MSGKPWVMTLAVGVLALSTCILSHIEGVQISQTECPGGYYTPSSIIDSSGTFTISQSSPKSTWNQVSPGTLIVDRDITETVYALPLPGFPPPVSTWVSAQRVKATTKTVTGALEIGTAPDTVGPKEPMGEIIDMCQDVKGRWYYKKER